MFECFHWIITRGLIDTETNNWFPTNQLVCHRVFSRTQEQKDINICRLQGLFFPACSVQPLQWAVTQPETARCRPATNAARTKHVRTVVREKNPTWKKAESSSPATLSSSPCCLLNPSLPGVTGSLKSSAFRLPAGGCNSPPSRIDKYAAMIETPMIDTCQTVSWCHIMIQISSVCTLAPEFDIIPITR